MRYAIPAVPALVGLLFAFFAGWCWNEHVNASKLSRITEERDAYFKLSTEALQMSDRALNASLENSATLEVCLGKLGLKPAALVPTQKPASGDPRRLAQFQP